MGLTNKTRNQPKKIVFETILGVRKWQNSIYGFDKTMICLYKVPFPLQPLVGLMYNGTAAKEQQKRPNKKSVKVSFVTSRTEIVRQRIFCSCTFINWGILSEITSLQAAHTIHSHIQFHKYLEVFYCWHILSFFLLVCPS